MTKQVKALLEIVLPDLGRFTVDGVSWMCKKIA